MQNRVSSEVILGHCHCRHITVDATQQKDLSFEVVTLLRVQNAYNFFFSKLTTTFSNDTCLKMKSSNYKNTIECYVPTKMGVIDRYSYIDINYKNVTNAHYKTVPGKRLRMRIIKTSFFSSGVSFSSTTIN